MEKTGYILLSIVAVVWIVSMFVGFIQTFSYGIIGIIAIMGVGL